MVPDDVRPVRAVLFDLHGTLYRQPPLRRRMARELLRLPFRIGFREGVRVGRALRLYRHAREELRRVGRGPLPLATLQYAVPARALGCPAEEVADLVREWILERPLPFLRPLRRPGARALMEGLGARGVRVGVLSDYPVRAKLEALELADLCDLELDTCDASINAFKPHPRGFERALELWDFPAEEVLYVGDRPEVDAAGAAAASLQAAIIDRRPSRGDTWQGYRDLEELARALDR